MAKVEKKKRQLHAYKFHEDVIDRLVQSLRVGNTLKVACQYADISQRTFRHWMRRGRLGEEKFDDFYKRIRKAIAAAPVNLVASIYADEDWRAKAWVLERRWPKDWSIRHLLKVDITTDEDVRKLFKAFAKIVFEEVEDEEIIKRIQKRARELIVEARYEGTKRIRAANKVKGEA